MNEYESLQRQQISQVQKTYELPDTETDEITKKKNILILEDEAAFAALIKETLESEGYNVATVSNGAEGLKKILTDDFEVILCDMVMPNFPGDMFYLAVERARPHLCKRFIFISGHQGDRNIDQFIRSIRGMMLWKPFEIHVLFDAIKAVISKK